MTLAQMITAVQNRVGQGFSSDTITSYLNDAQVNMVVNSSKRFYAEQSLAMKTSEFSQPADCLVLKSVAWKDAFSNIITVLNLADDPVPPTLEYGTPKKYAPLESATATHFLFPTPQVAGYLLFNYIKKPPDLTESADTSTLDDADNALVAYATWKCLFDDKQYTEATAWRDEYMLRRAEWLNLDALQASRRSFIIEDNEWW